MKSLTHVRCVQGFNQSSHHDILKVYQNMHTGESPYTCTLCTNGFTQATTVQNQKGIHTLKSQVKSLTNIQCVLKDLKTHQRIHTNETPYTYVVCKKDFENL